MAPVGARDENSSRSWLVDLYGDAREHLFPSSAATSQPRLHPAEEGLVDFDGPSEELPAGTPPPPAPRAQERAVEHVRQIDRRTYTVGSRTVDWSEAQFVLTG